MKVNNKILNKVIILGQDHHNALCVARQLYLAGIKPYGIIVALGKCPVITKSKYWAAFSCVKNEDDGIRRLLELYGSEQKKPVLITCTDRFAAIVDQRLSILSQKFICPGVNTQGLLIKMMNKKWQHCFCKENNINVVPTENYNLESWNISSIEDDLHSKNILSPYIIKPLASINGDKNDIKICNDEKELSVAIRKLVNLNYKEILIQHFLDFDYEMLVVGACFINNKSNQFILNKVNRINPPKRGTECYLTIITDTKLLDKVNYIFNTLRSTSYHGLIDIELFYKNGEVYLNEFNLRSSGCSYIGNKQRILYAANYVIDATGSPIAISSPFSSAIKTGTSMTEYSDVRYPMRFGYSLKKWIVDFLGVDDYAYLHHEDIKPMVVLYLKLFKNHLIH